MCETPKCDKEIEMRISVQHLDEGFEARVRELLTVASPQEVADDQ